MNLRYDLYGAPSEHPQTVMRQLGITYVAGTPQTMGDCWWFWGCQNAPAVLPVYLKELPFGPKNDRSLTTDILEMLK